MKYSREQKVRNPKFEYRNPKQAQIFKIRNTKRFGYLNIIILKLFRISCFEFSICGLVLLMVITFVNYSHASPFDGLKKTYSGVNSLEAAFHQKIFIASLKKERTFEGDFYYKRHKGFLWKYRTPKVKFFLYDGQYMWQGEDEKPFVVKERIRKEKTTGTFLDLIEDIARMDELFTLKQQSIAGSLEVLEIVPKKDSTVNAAKIWIDKQNIVRKIEIHEFTGNVNTIEFSAVKINQGVDDGRFIYRPEKGKEIVER